MEQQNPWAGAGVTCFKNSTEARNRAGKEKGSRRWGQEVLGARSPRALDWCRILAFTPKKTWLT